MEGFIDVHHHLAYGMDDDGPQTFEESVQMLQNAHRNGVRMIVMTPHFIPGIRAFNNDDYLLCLEQLRRYIQEMNLFVTIQSGAEVMYTELTCDFLRQSRIPTLGNTNYILVEFPAEITFENLIASLNSIHDTGYISVLAHMERYRCLRVKPQRIYALKNKTNTLLQMNCETILKKDFLLVWWKRELLRSGLIDIVASDAHNNETRSVKMREAYEWIEMQVGIKCAQHIMGCIRSNGFWREIYEY